MEDVDDFGVAVSVQEKQMDFGIHSERSQPTPMLHANFGRIRCAGGNLCVGDKYEPQPV